MNMPLNRRRWVPVTIAVVVLVGCAAAVVLARPAAQPVAAEPMTTAGATPSPKPTTDATTPEAQAKADLERLVREYYAAENAVYLDPASDPSAALDPYLRNPASGARIADILSFRNAGHTFESRSSTIHSVELSAIDLASAPATATLMECHTNSGSGIDGESGEPGSFSNRRLTTWTANALPDGAWRLYSYDSDEPGSC